MGATVLFVSGMVGNRYCLDRTGQRPRRVPEPLESSVEGGVDYSVLRLGIHPGRTKDDSTNSRRTKLEPCEP